MFFGAVGWGGRTRKYKQSNLNLDKRLLLITKNKHLRLIILVFFHIWKMQEPGVIEILPKTCFDLGACLSKAQSASSCFSFWIPLRRHCSGFQLNPCIGGWWVMLFVLLCSRFLCSLKLFIESTSLWLWDWNPHFLAACQLRVTLSSKGHPHSLPPPTKSAVVGCILLTLLISPPSSVNTANYDQEGSQLLKTHWPTWII